MERFWTKVAILGTDDCWLWEAGMTQGGYGTFQGSRSHRVAWELTHGPIPDGVWVLHKCEGRYPKGTMTSRLCCNPAHLALGDRAQNALDAKAAGHKTGVPTLQVPADFVESVRPGVTNQELATKYDVSVSSVSNWVVEAGLQGVRKRGRANSGKSGPRAPRITPAQDAAIRDMRARGVHARVVAAELGLSMSAVQARSKGLTKVGRPKSLKY